VAIRTDGQGGARILVTRLSSTPAWVQAFLVGAVLLVVGFGDGLGYSLVNLTGQRSPWIFLLPVLGVPVFSYLVASGPQAIRRADKTLLATFVAFSLVVLAAEILFVRDFYLVGLLQLLTFVASFMVIRAIFISAPTWLDTALRRSLVPIHFFLCGYVIVAYLTWQISCVDPSLFSALTGATAPAVTYYGFRPIGFGLEPQWSATALAASYIGVYYLVPDRRAMGFVALAAASLLLASATAAVFLFAVVAGYVVSQLVAARRDKRGLAVALASVMTGVSQVQRAAVPAVLMLLASTALVVVAVTVSGVGRLGCHLPVNVPAPTQASPTLPVAGTAPPSVETPPPVAALPSSVEVQLERIGNIFVGRDPSTSQRVISASVALRVIEQSFPLGVGYGNFRRYAKYPEGFEAYVANLAEDSRYKSDSFVLNYVAELGLLGLVLVTWVGALFAAARCWLPLVLLGMLTVLSGTLLLPPVLAIAAVVGLLRRDALTAASQIADRLAERART
jgi:hypothetical protein